jgi:hypothetical protein
VTPFPTIDALREGLGGKAASAAPAIDPAYAAKMLHPLPANATVVNRRAFILERAAGKVVLDVGATGPMHALLVQKAAKVYGWDREDGPGVTGVNLDAVGLQLPVYPDVELIVLGEVLEHLSNPGHFLNALRAAYACPTIVTVPNAYCMLGRGHLARGYDCVNGDAGGAAGASRLRNTRVLLLQRQAERAHLPGRGADRRYGVSAYGCRQEECALSIPHAPCRLDGLRQRRERPDRERHQLGHHQALLRV